LLTFPAPGPKVRPALSSEADAKKAVAVVGVVVAVEVAVELENIAKTLVFPDITNEQSELVPEHGPLQPVKIEPVAAVAVSDIVTTEVCVTDAAVQSVPQVRSGEVTVSLPTLTTPVTTPFAVPVLDKLNTAACVTEGIMTAATKIPRIIIFFNFD
jgi:hypothetical protein